MNKKIIIASLSDVANELDQNGLYKESKEITQVMQKLSQNKIFQDLLNPNAAGLKSQAENWINKNQTAVNNALASPKPMLVLSQLLMNIQPVALANEIRKQIGEMKQGYAQR